MLRPGAAAFCLLIGVVSVPLSAQEQPPDVLPLLEELRRGEERTPRTIESSVGKPDAPQTDATGDLIGTRGSVLVDTDGGYANAGTVLLPTGTSTDVIAKLPGTTGRFSVFRGAYLTPLLTVHGDGRVSIGVAEAPSWSRVSILSNTKNSIALYGSSSSTIVGTEAVNDSVASFSSYQATGAGAVNTGTVNGARSTVYLTGTGRVQEARGLFAEVQVYPDAASTGTITNALGARFRINSNSGAITNGYALYIEDVKATADYAVYQTGADDSNYFAGNVGIGTASPTKALDVVGDAHFTGTVTGGNIKAKYQDVAEWVPATHDLTPGTVVILNPTKRNEVMASTSAYDTTVAGVVSAQPGLSLGEEGEGKEQVATTGRVKVRVDARNAPIRVGDLLVTSDIPGTAMRSEPMEIHGRRFHQPGTIIGKALEPLDSGAAEILVLLSMQ